jgi:hypothetical protein
LILFCNGDIIQNNSTKAAPFGATLGTVWGNFGHQTATAASLMSPRLSLTHRIGVYRSESAVRMHTHGPVVGRGEVDGDEKFQWAGPRSNAGSGARGDAGRVERRRRALGEWQDGGGQERGRRPVAGRGEAGGSPGGEAVAGPGRGRPGGGTASGGTVAVRGEAGGRPSGETPAWPRARSAWARRAQGDVVCQGYFRLNISIHWKYGTTGI